MAKIDWGKIAQGYEDTYNKKYAQENNKSIAKHSEFLNEMAVVNEANMKKKSIVQFRRDVKQSLMETCIYTIYNEAFGNKIDTIDNEDVIKKNIVSKFVTECGVDKLLNSFKNKSYLLSEYAYLIENYTEYLFEKAKETGVMEVDEKDKASFFESIYGDEVKDVGLTIKSRVAQAIADFNLKNAEDKMDIENIISISKEKIDNAATERLKEQYQLDANTAINKIRQRKKTIFEAMVNNMGKAFYVNESMKEQLKDAAGRIDMDKVVDTCEIMYTFLETIKTAKIIDVDEEYLENFLKSFKK